MSEPCAVKYSRSALDVARHPGHMKSANSTTLIGASAGPFTLVLYFCSAPAEEATAALAAGTAGFAFSCAKAEPAMVTTATKAGSTRRRENEFVRAVESEFMIPGSDGEVLGFGERRASLRKARHFLGPAVRIRGLPVLDGGEGRVEPLSQRTDRSIGCLEAALGETELSHG